MQNAGDNASFPSRSAARSSLGKREQRTAEESAIFGCHVQGEILALRAGCIARCCCLADELLVRYPVRLWPARFKRTQSEAPALQTCQDLCSGKPSKELPGRGVQ